MQEQLEIINHANAVIKDGLSLLPERATREWKANANPEVTVGDAIDAAAKLLAAEDAKDSPLLAEKVSMLVAFSVQEANRMASTLWRLEALTEGIEKEYRELPRMEVVADNYNEYIDERQKRSDELTEKGNEIQEEKRELEIFMGVVNGVPAEDAERQYDEFRNAQRQALTGGR